MATGKGVVKGKVRDAGLERRWRRVMVEQRRSGLNVREFCRRGQLAESSFHYWRRELQRRQAESSPRRQAQPSRRCRAERPRRGRARSAPAFVAVRVEEHGGGPGGGRPAGGHVEIVLRCGRCVRVTAPVDRVVLTDVVSVLEGLPVAVASDSRGGRAVGRAVRRC